MNNQQRKFSVTIKKTRQGKPYYETYGLPGAPESERDAESPMHDALDFPGERGVEELKNEVKRLVGDVEFGIEFRPEFRIKQRPDLKEIDRIEFARNWRDAIVLHRKIPNPELHDDFGRIVQIELTGKDRVRWWSGWFHYPILIEESKLQMADSATRLKTLLDDEQVRERDVIEEAYYEQVQRQRLAIYERRRENWRIIRWGATTVLGMVLASWSVLQIWDRFLG